MSNEPPTEPEKPSQPVVHITFPTWLTVEWGTPFVGALLSVLIGVGLMYLVGLLLVIGALIVSPTSIPWASFARIPPAIWLGYNLGVSPVVIILTGFIWIRLSLRLAARRIAAEVEGTRNKVLEGATKFAVVYAFLELAMAIALKQYHSPVQAGFALTPSGAITGVDPVGAFIYGLLIGFAAGLYFFSKLAGVRIRDLWPVRIDSQLPDVARTTWHGLVTTLKIAVPGMMVFMYLSVILSLIGRYAPPKYVVGLIPTMLAFMILWTGIDTGLSGMLVAMQLFLGRGTVGFSLPPFFQTPSWIYAGIAIPLIALFIGGIRVARESRSLTPPQAAVRGWFIGIPLSLVCVIFASLHSLGTPGGFIGRAFLVSFLWGGASALGAFFEAAQHPPEQPALPPATP